MDATEAWLGRVSRVAEVGQVARGTVEELAGQITFDMNYPVVMHGERWVNYAFMAAEAAYIISGRNDVGYLMAAMKKFGNYSDDGYFQTGSYGPPYVDQLPYVIDVLRADNTSRQAVIDIWRRSPRQSKDIPCTLSLQFLIRDNRLHTIVSMRSSDVWTGLIYDMFCFSVMSAVVAASIGADIALGECTITAGSSHIYAADFAKAEDILENGGLVITGPRLIPLERDEMFWLLDPIRNYAGGALDALWEAFPDASYS